MTFAAYISCFYAEFSFDFVTLTFDLLTLAMSGELSFACPVHISVFSILKLSVPESCVTQSDHITFTWNGQCAWAVSRDLSPAAKMIHVFEIHEPISYSLCHFYSARRGLSHIIGEKWRFPILKVTKFNAHTVCSSRSYRHCAWLTTRSWFNSEFIWTSEDTLDIFGISRRCVSQASAGCSVCLSPLRRSTSCTTDHYAHTVCEFLLIW